MTNNDNQYTIYIRSTKESIPVSKEEFDAYYHDINIYRIRQQRHGRCVCSASKRLTCDMDCLTCPFHRIYCASASQMFRVPVEKHGVNGHLRQKGKIAELALGYGGSVGALKAMGALEMGLTEEELQPLVQAWRAANPNIVKFWWDVDRAVLTAVRDKTTAETHGIRFLCRSGMLSILLPSGRMLNYVKPKIGENRFGGSCITYEGVGGTKKWERLDSYGPKFVENIVQATARDILCYAMKTLRCCSVTMHIHDELVIEADPRVSLDTICEQMGRTPPWAKGLLLRADGYVTEFYKKD